jgi:5'-nucleotidase
MAKKLAPSLREQGAEMIVALTHMVLHFHLIVLIQREHNDVLLANSVPDGLIDIILGGHDHFVSSSMTTLISVQRANSKWNPCSSIRLRFQTTIVHRGSKIIK